MRATEKELAELILQNHVAYCRLKRDASPTPAPTSPHREMSQTP